MPFSVAPGMPDSRCRPDPAIFLLDEIRIAQTFTTTVTPFPSLLLVQAFGESFRQAIGEGLRHDRVVVVVFRPEPVAQFLQSDPAGYRERADVIAQAGFFGRDKVGKRSAGLTTFFIGLLAEEVQLLKHLLAFAVRVKFDVIAHGARREKNRKRRVP